MKRLFEKYEKQKLLNPSERKIMSSALEIRTKRVEDVMTPMSSVFMIDINTNLNKQMLKKIYSEGYSRIPVFDGDKDNIVGLLLSRDLVLLQLDNSIVTLRQLSSILIRQVIMID